MGSAESVFTDETTTPNTNTTADPPPPPPTAAAAATTTTTTTTTGSSRAGPLRPRRIQKPSTAVELPPLERLTGRIFGLPKSGKHTLIQRLQGKDPFAQRHPVADENQKDGRIDNDQRTESVVVPYRVPAAQPSWDRITLQVDIDNERSRCQKSIDFAILMVDPRHNKEQVEHHLTDCIKMLLHLHGFSSGERSNQIRPFCLCVLLNFCDEIAPKHLEKVIVASSATKIAHLITESDLQQMTLLSLQDVDVEPSQLLLQCGTTSLLNCYGLLLLHHFIYQSYLLRKEWQLKDTLHRVITAQVQARAAVPIPIPYMDYVRGLENRDEPAALSSSSQPPNIHGKKIPLRDEARTESMAPTEAEPMRKVVEKGTQQIPPRPVTDDLEAFLASDSDDDRRNCERTSLARKSLNLELEDGEDDDSEDDDYFYDSHGDRHSVRNEAKAANAGFRRSQHKPYAEPTRAYGKNNQGDKVSMDANTSQPKATDRAERRSNGVRRVQSDNDADQRTKSVARSISKNSAPNHELFSKSPSGSEESYIGETQLVAGNNSDCQGTTSELLVETKVTNKATGPKTCSQRRENASSVDEESQAENKSERNEDESMSHSDALNVLRTKETTVKESALISRKNSNTDEQKTKSFPSPNKSHPLTLAASTPIQDDDSEDFFIDEETEAQKSIHIEGDAPNAESTKIDEVTASQSIAIISSSEPSLHQRNSNESRQVRQSGGLSTAVLAAIASAQEEAERMLEVKEQHEIKLVHAKKEKKKKEKKEKRGDRKKSRALESQP